MDSPTLCDSQTNRPYVQTNGGALQIYSDPESNFSPDACILSDGRIIRITSASTASMGRLQFGLAVVSSPYSLGHKGCLGSAGTFYLSPSGAWELYPCERLLSSSNRSGPAAGIHCSQAANRRAAALMLLSLSDELCRDSLDYVKPAEGLKVGRWRVKPLGLKAGDFTPTKPAPQSVPVRCHTQRHFLATLQADSPSLVSVRIIVEAWDYGNGVSLRATVKAIAGESLDNLPKAPQSVVDACLSRCYPA